MTEYADRVAVELVARVDKYEADLKGAATIFNNSTESMERSALALEKIVESLANNGGNSFRALGGQARKAANDIEVGSGRAANATRNLGRQVSDIGVGLASGQSPFLILAQQAPQVADALADTGGKAAKLAAFFAGPWGAALLAAASIAGVLAGKLLDGGDAADKHRASTKSLEEAIHDLNITSGKAIQTSYQSAQAALQEAVAQRQAEIDTRRHTKALLDQAIAQRLAVKAGADSGEPGSDANSLFLPFADRAISALRAEIGKQDSAIAESARNIVNLKIPVIQQQVAAATDKSTAATFAYEKRVAELNGALKAGVLNEIEYTRSLTHATNVRDAALKALSDSQKAASRASREAQSQAKKEAKEYADALRDLAAAGAQANDSIKNIKFNKDDLRSYADIFKGIGTFSDDPLSVFHAAEAERDAAARLKKVKDDERKEDRRKQEADIRSLADLYESAFRGGSGSIWDTFKEQGIKTIALLLAKFTLLQLASIKSGGGTGSILSNLGQAAASIFSPSPTGGRASGGAVTAGMLYRVNEGASPGRVEGFRPQGSGTIIPLGQMRAAQPRGGVTIIAPQQFDLTGVLMTPDVLRELEARNRDYANRVAAAAGRGAVTAVPGRVASFQKLGS